MQKEKQPTYRITKYKPIHINHTTNMHAKHIYIYKGYISKEYVELWKGFLKVMKHRILLANKKKKNCMS